jgi:hypothetical protein
MILFIQLFRILSIKEKQGQLDLNKKEILYPWLPGFCFQIPISSIIIHLMR